MGTIFQNKVSKEFICFVTPKALISKLIFATLPVHDSFCDFLKAFIGITLQNLDGNSGGPQTPAETRYLNLFKTTNSLGLFFKGKSNVKETF